MKSFIVQLKDMAGPIQIKAEEVFTAYSENGLVCLKSEEIMVAIFPIEALVGIWEKTSVE